MPKSTDLTGQGRTVYDQLNVVLQQKKPIFLKIYAKWCGACKGMATAWSDLCKNDEMAKTDVNFLAIEEDAMNALKIHEKCPESLKTIFNDVKGFPTLVFLNIVVVVIVVLQNIGPPKKSQKKGPSVINHDDDDDNKHLQYLNIPIKGSHLV